MDMHCVRVLDRPVRRVLTELCCVVEEACGNRLADRVWVLIRLFVDFDAVAKGLELLANISCPTHGTDLLASAGCRGISSLVAAVAFLLQI